METRGGSDPAVPEGRARPSVALGFAIRRARAGRFTLAQLSERSGVSAGLLSLIERGRGNPSINTLASIAGALEVSLPDLVAVAIESDSNRLVATLSPHPADGPVSGADVDTSANVVDDVPSAEWATSMLLHGGQEARVLVLDGSLELALRDRTSTSRSAAGRPLSVDLQIRPAAAETLQIPPTDDPRWRDLALGEIPFEPGSLAGRMLFTHAIRCVRQDPSSPNVERWVRELRGFFVKYEAVSAAELAQIFLPAEQG